MSDGDLELGFTGQNPLLSLGDLTLNLGEDAFEATGRFLTGDHEGISPGQLSIAPAVAPTAGDISRVDRALGAYASGDPSALSSGQISALKAGGWDPNQGGALQKGEALLFRAGLFNIPAPIEATPLTLSPTVQNTRPTDTTNTLYSKPPPLPSPQPQRVETQATPQGTNTVPASTPAPNATPILAPVDTSVLDAPKADYSAPGTSSNVLQSIGKGVAAVGTLLWNDLLKPVLSKVVGTVADIVGRILGSTIGQKLQELLDPNSANANYVLIAALLAGLWWVAT